MPKIKFIEASGEEHVVDATAGQSVMQAAMDNLVPGIVAECGGYANCATCHVYVDAAWTDELPRPEANEAAMVECAFEVQANSRLSCQLTVTPELDGLIVRIPSSQMG
ncbi:2Fe-2S iron-sulfur cluster binding domain-containing protein [Pseudenhygromyxa sp. WMMC2535]|uniref:2Fe-2S iron-sulfur cluster-binding protein n=1 Tax=Pseudenhygromyxa sp. WMMC2535 TaxID=2712867 RepID=UPI0015572F09|nr:2Fe-2S iron-sulfur cluster binding domain-containing protein [Pseudenhygromyxa sp. WMMC2535]